MSACAMVLLAGCGEQDPGSTMDGIYTTAQAERGEALFTQHCARCHSLEEFSGRRFGTLWSDVPASALYQRIGNTMPMDQPGSLGTDQVTALMAHIFATNDMPAGEAPLAADLEWLTEIPIRVPD